MKTNAFKYLGIALMALMMISLTSCEVEIDSFYDDDNIGGGYYSRSSELCSRTWISYYRDADGNRCCQELDFYLDRTGVDYIRVDTVTEMWKFLNIISGGTGKTMHKHLSGCPTVRVMFPIWMMCTLVETD